MQNRTKKRIRIAGLLIVLGLIAELFSFVWVGPSAFMLFIGGSFVFCGLGISLYLIMLYSGSRRTTINRSNDRIMN